MAKVNPIAAHYGEKDLLSFAKKQARIGNYYNAYKALLDHTNDLAATRPAPKADSALVGELVPCPFCGDTEPYLEPTGTNFRIACSNPDCAASGPSGPSEGCAVGAWNGAALALNRAADALAALSDRDVVLEEAAKKIDQRASYHGDQDQGPRRQAAWKEARECAATIRALKGGVDE